MSFRSRVWAKSWNLPRFSPGWRGEGRLAVAGADGWLLIVVSALCAFGLVMVYSASEALGYLWFSNPSYFFQRQLISLILGGIAFVIVSRLDYHRLRVHAGKIAQLTLALLILVLIPHLGAQHNGSQRWFVVGPVSIQPSAIAILAAIIFFSRWLLDHGPGLRTGAGVRDYCVLLGALLGLIVFERDLGSSIVVAGTGVALLALAGARKRHLMVLVAGLLLVGLVLVNAEAYRASRLANFANPCADPLGSGFQGCQALYALGSGGLSGVGLGHSIQKYQWLPEAHTDFIYAIVGEELGFIGTFSVLLAFLFISWRGIRTSLRAPDLFGSLLAGGITAWISIGAFINMAAVTGVIPTTGIPLPFVSYGGTSLIMTLIGIGILANISAQGRRQGETRRASFDRWWRDGGPSHALVGRRSGTPAPR